MRSKYYFWLALMAILAIFGLIAIIGFYLGENALKIIGLGVSVPVGILSLISKMQSKKTDFLGNIELLARTSQRNRSLRLQQ
jgi:uncharacterized membrane protein YccF (DUF307 family)